MHVTIVSCDIDQFLCVMYLLNNVITKLRGINLYCELRCNDYAVNYYIPKEILNMTRLESINFFPFSNYITIQHNIDYTYADAPHNHNLYNWKNLVNLINVYNISPKLIVCNGHRVYIKPY